MLSTEESAIMSSSKSSDYQQSFYNPTQGTISPVLLDIANKDSMGARNSSTKYASARATPMPYHVQQPTHMYSMFAQQYDTFHDASFSYGGTTMVESNAAIALTTLSNDRNWTNVNKAMMAKFGSSDMPDDDSCHQQLCEENDCDFTIQCQGNGCDMAFQFDCARAEHVQTQHGVSRDTVDRGTTPSLRSCMEPYTQLERSCCHVGACLPGFRWGYCEIPNCHPGSCQLDANNVCQLGPATSNFSAPEEPADGLGYRGAQRLTKRLVKHPVEPATFAPLTSNPGVFEYPPPMMFGDASAVPNTMGMNIHDQRFPHEWPSQNNTAIDTAGTSNKSLTTTATPSPTSASAPSPGFDSFPSSKSSTPSVQSTAGGQAHCGWVEAAIGSPCRVEFADTAGLHEHVLGIHLGLALAGGQWRGRARKGSLVCRWKNCERANEARPFDQTQHLKDHIATHTKYRPVVCEYCDRPFKDRKELKQHSTVHTGNKPYSCNLCGGRFAHKSSLNTHVMTKHTKQRPHKCPICGHETADGANFRRHRAIHDTPKYGCHFCGKKTHKRSNNKRHEMTCKKNPNRRT